MSAGNDSPQLPHRTVEEIRAWLVTYLARLLHCQPADIDVNVSFDRLGLDSGTAVGSTLDLEDWFGRPVEPTLLYDFPTIARLVEELARRQGASES
jgi:acyl carrier protein